MEKQYPNAPILIILANQPKGEPHSLVISTNMDESGKRNLLQTALDHLSTGIIVPRQKQ